jgi:hypothetical protein
VSLATGAGLSAAVAAGVGVVVGVVVGAATVVDDADAQATAGSVAATITQQTSINAACLRRPEPEGVGAISRIHANRPWNRR